MSAKQWLGKYLDTKLPADRLLFHVAMVLSMLECFALLLFTVFLRMDIHVPALLMLGMALTAAAAYAENRGDQIRIISMGYLFLMHMILIPVVSGYVPYAIYDFPVYFLTGIAFTVILLRKKRAFFFVAAEMAVDFVCIYHMVIQEPHTAAVHEGITQYNLILFGRIIVALFVTGTVCGLLISYRNVVLRREIEKSAEMERRAEQLSYARNMFLVNVSHEIRTPLNAILGITELLFDLDADDRLKENAFHLSNSSKALLSITNELMDFTKLDNNDMTVTDRPYSLGDICNEMINVVSVRFADHKTELFVGIEPDIPAQLRGDAALVRQMLLNLLTGVMKSIESGEVYLKLWKTSREKGKVDLAAEVRAEGEFLYSYKERAFHGEKEQGECRCEEGIVSLPVRLAGLMGGTVSMEEETACRTYRVTVPQGYLSQEPLIRPKKRKECILFYENTIIQGRVFADTLRSMKLDFCQAATNDFFYEECVKSCYTHILIAAERYDGVRHRLEELLAPQSVILIGTNILSYDDTLIRTTFARPVNCLNMDALLGSKQNSTIRHVGYRGGFTCPGARVMVVDDNMINLEVATSILNRYQAQVLVAASGRECLSMLRQEKVDFIFLDYMMPEMDGIDTLKKIRELAVPGLKEVPVVALTANAVSGAREMFMNAGFDEYISKPIELDKFEKVLRSYLPKHLIAYAPHKADQAEM
ncbi:MAG: response regulator [Lachnospiraceae bacterium]|nr:response regulator [Lachnospiraceae bacterium]